MLGEVLAALQRIGRRPPPAILVRPEDALASVRSAILLGAVVPDLRNAADKLASDLNQLVSLKNELARERDRMRDDASTLAEDRARVEFLIAERQSKRDASAAQLAEQEASRRRPRRAGNQPQGPDRADGEGSRRRRRGQGRGRGGRRETQGGRRNRPDDHAAEVARRVRTV